MFRGFVSFSRGWWDRVPAAVVQRPWCTGHVTPPSVTAYSFWISVVQQNHRENQYFCWKTGCAKKCVQARILAQWVSSKKTVCFVYFSIVKAKCCHSLLVEFGMFVIAPFVWRSEMVFISGAIYRAIVDKGDIYGAILRYWGAAKSKINFLGGYPGARMTD